jgi:hypothetical protein
LSAYLFIITIELLAIHIRDNKNIKGIKIGNEELKISLLADDITLLLEDTKSINLILNTLKSFRECAGLKINLEKTSAKYIGQLKDHDYYPHGLSWIKTPIHTLGINIVDSEDLNYNLNFKQKICNLKTTLNIWKQRNLSIKGKITIINNIALSPLIYISSVTNTPKKAIEEINNLIQSFLWNNSTSKIAQKTLIQEIQNGGLKLSHYQTKVESLLLTWVKRLTSPSKHNWKIIPRLYYKCNNLSTYFDANHKLLNDKPIPTFYKDIHSLFMKHFKKDPINTAEILNQSLWLNENIKMNNMYIYHKHWEKQGINRIKDIFNEHGIPLNCGQIKIKYKLSVNYLHLLQIQKSIPKAWINNIYNTHNLNISNNIKDNTMTLKINQSIKTLQSIKCNEFYWHIINQSNYTSKNIQKWENTITEITNNHINWGKVYSLAFKTVRETKLQSLQYRILHKTIQCNEWLYNLKIRSSNICEFCNLNVIDNLIHFFIQCPICKTFWISLIQWWHKKN